MMLNISHRLGRNDRSRLIRPLAGIACLAAAALIAGCGDDPVEQGSASTIVEDSATSSSAASTTAADATPGVVEVDMADFKFVNVPASVPVGTTLSVKNSSAGELHELIAFRLPDDELRPAKDLVALGEEGLNAVVNGPPTMVLLAKPGGHQIAAFGDGTLTKPGRYVLLCNIPTGVNPDEYLARSQQGPPQPAPGDGPPHLMSGMYSELNVT